MEGHKSNKEQRNRVWNEYMKEIILHFISMGFLHKLNTTAAILAEITRKYIKCFI
jgi:hypothetical protein